MENRYMRDFVVLVDQYGNMSGLNVVVVNKNVSDSRLVGCHVLAVKVIIFILGTTRKLIASAAFAVARARSISLILLVAGTGLLIHP